jgi:hypothetical protein
MKKIYPFLFLLLLSSGIIKAQSFTWTKVVDVQYPTGLLFDDNSTMWYIVQGTGLFEKSGSNSINHSSGLITNNIISIASDNPLIWTGGYGGITSFDGTNFDTYNNSTGLMGYALYDIDAQNGNAWIAMESEGASYFDGTSWTHYTPTNGLSGDWFTSVKRNNAGIVYVSSNDNNNGTIGVLNVYNGTSWNSLGVSDGLNIHNIISLHVDGQDNLWIGGKALVKYDGTAFTTIVPDTISVYHTIASIAEDNSGNIWFAKQNQGGVFIYNGTDVINTNAPESFQGKPQGLAVNSQGEVFACLETGIFKVVPTSFTVTATANPTAGGTITGAGNYVENQTATLVASPSANYVFTNWTENGTTVSTNSTYSFSVTADRNLTANFQLSNGIHELLNPKISLYPNPADNILIMKTKEIDLSDKKVSISLTDISGKLNNISYTKKDNNTIFINLDNKLSGIYFLNIIIDDKIYKVEKVVIK